MRGSVGLVHVRLANGGHLDFCPGSCCSFPTGGGHATKIIYAKRREAHRHASCSSQLPPRVRPPKPLIGGVEDDVASASGHRIAPSSAVSPLWSTEVSGDNSTPCVLLVCNQAKVYHSDASIAALILRNRADLSNQDPGSSVAGLSRMVVSSFKASFLCMLVQSHRARGPMH